MTLTKSRLAPVVLFIAALALGGAACDRSKLTESNGRAYREAFSRQVANPSAAMTAQRTQQGLDSQEAAIVSKTYRQNLAPKQDEAARGQMLYSGPARAQSDRAELPPPSVPNER
jgi:hypothetical protein